MLRDYIVAARAWGISAEPLNPLPHSLARWLDALIHEAVVAGCAANLAQLHRPGLAYSVADSGERE